MELDMSDSQFPGFKRAYKDEYFKYPNELAQFWWMLSGSEQKLLDFILRRTYGYQKLEDYISLSQFVNGVGKSKGSGVSRAQAQRSIAELERKGFISTERHGYQTRLIKLVLRDDVDGEPVKGKAPASDETAYLISLFQGVSPHLIEKFMTEKRQVLAIERLVAYYGHDKVAGFIQAAQEAFGKEFAPNIGSPVELEEKLSKLVSYYSRVESAKSSGFKITID